MLLRDTRTILITVVAPLVLFPVVILMSRAVERRDQRRVEEATYHYAVTGSEAGLAHRLTERALEMADPDSGLAPALFVEHEVSGADSLVRVGDVHLVVEGLSPEEYRRIRAGEGASEDSDVDIATEDVLPRVPVIRLHYRSDRDVSRTAMERFRGRLEEVRRLHRDSVYRAHGLPVTGRFGVLESQNVASAERMGGALLGVILTPLLLFLMLSGGSIVAVDAISGEKERGTLETLLTTAALRSEIVNAKQLAVITVGVAVTVINLLNLLVYVVLGLIDLPQNLAVQLSAVSLLLLLGLFLPLTVLVSSALLLLSGYARSYKEYQMYFFPSSSSSSRRPWPRLYPAWTSTPRSRWFRSPEWVWRCVRCSSESTTGRSWRWPSSPPVRRPWVRPGSPSARCPLSGSFPRPSWTRRI